MTDKLRGILIDPVAKSITEVQTEPYPEWKKLIEVDLITAVTIHIYDDGWRETLWVDDEGLINEKRNGPFFGLTIYPQPLAGRGIILATDEGGDTRSTRLTAEQVERFIVWRPHIKFTGMKTIEPHTEKHPLFGDVTVVGAHPQFEPLPDEEDKK